MPPVPSPDSGFDRVAAFYDRLARLVFGDTLNRAQAAFLTAVPKGAGVLIIGGGSGWLLKRVLAECAPAGVVYLEASSRMLELARQKTSGDKRVDFRHGNELTLRPDDRFDVVFTPFLLDLFSENRLRQQLLPRLDESLRSGGLWFCADFGPPRRGWQRLFLQTMYHFFGLTADIEARQLANWPRLLERALRLRRVQFRTFWSGFILSSVWQKPADAFSVPLEPDLIEQ